MDDNLLRDTFEGCLLGGAAGDALGYAIEFSSEDSIFFQFGEDGIATLKEASNGHVAHFSDDTQMTLFTANGLTYGAETREDGVPTSADIWLAYREWLGTQYDESRMDDPAKPKMWIYSFDSLHALRAPGNTCLGAIRYSRDGGTPEQPVNDSKGCGGVMRVAPVGLYAATHPAVDAARLGAEAAALTHGHPLGWIPAAVLAELVRSLVCDRLEGRNRAEALTGYERCLYLLDKVQLAMDTVTLRWPDLPDTRVQSTLVNRAIDLGERRILSSSTRDTLADIHELGEGWVGEEALAIAVYACVAHAGSFADAMRCAVNHRGDSDSTGAVAGNILGAYLGRKLVEETFDLGMLEERDLIARVADSLL